MFRVSISGIAILTLGGLNFLELSMGSKDQIFQVSILGIVNMFLGRYLIDGFLEF